MQLCLMQLPDKNVQVQQNSRKMYNWCCADRLWLNLDPAEKNYAFHTLHKKKKVDVHHNLHLNNNIVLNSKSVGLLGVTSNFNLTRENHCNNLISKLNTIISKLPQLK